MIDFQLENRQQELIEKVENFIREQIIPLESEVGTQQIKDELRVELNNRARAAKLLAPHVPVEFGGMGLNHIDCALVFEAAGYSLLGPIALHCAAPDEGNMNLLARVASEEQKQRWLAPLASAQVRSCFSMTEPSSGAGSDPSLMQTTYRSDGDDYLISGRKWLITGAENAGFSIIMARPEGSDDKSKATMFLTDMDAPGIRLVRQIETTDRTFTGGHGELEFDSVRVSKADILGEEGEGYKYAQVRLAPARLTHCMRWLGAAKRTHDIASEYAKQRTAFGKRLIDHEGVGYQLADNEIDLHQVRLAIWHTAWLLDNGKRATRESSQTKVFCSELLDKIADRSQQVMGGLGVTHDTVVAQIATEIRAFRIYDGPSEVHRWSLAKAIGRR